MNDTLNQYIALRNTLQQERAQIQSRLEKIQAALGGGSTPQTEIAAKPVAKRGPGRPKLNAAKPIVAAKVAKKGRSAETKAKMAAAQQARWARIRAAKKSPVQVSAKAPAKKKGQMSAAGRAAIVAAQKARWAKIKAAKAGK